MVEVLVVLVIIGTMAGALTLALARLGRDPETKSEADLLAGRLQRAAETAFANGQIAALVWEADAYRFTVFDAGVWTDHAMPMLGKRILPPGLGLRDETEAMEGRYRIHPDLLPDGDILLLRLGSGDTHHSIRFDGARATVGSGGAP